LGKPIKRKAKINKRIHHVACSQPKLPFTNPSIIFIKN
jgi:hypothetical protein